MTSRLLPLSAILAVCLLCVFPLWFRLHAPQAATQTTRFIVADVKLNSSTSALAAWQVDVSTAIPGGRVELVGVEGSPDAGSAFAKPAYYDPAALRQNRVVLGAFSTKPAVELPRGETTVARLHFAVTGGGQAAPTFAIKLITAADERGAVIEPTCTILLGDRP